MRWNVPPVGPLIAVLVPGLVLSCQFGSGSVGGAEDLRAEIGERWDAYSRSLLEADAGALAGFFTTDARLMEPGMEDRRGRDEIQEFIQSGFAELRVMSISIQTLEVEGCSGSIYEAGLYHEGVIGQDGGRPTTHRGRYVALWRRGPEGKLRIHRLMLNRLPAPGVTGNLAGATVP